MTGLFPPTRSGRPRRTASAARGLVAGHALGNVSPGHQTAIAHSHERCAALGLSRIERPDHALIGMSDLAVARDRNFRLYAHAAPVMEMLHEQITNTDSMVVLTDATGTILHSIGDAEFLGKASKVALQPGANWSEGNKGTNAVGTALVDEVPTLVHAEEHFMHANHFLTCSAAPILDPRGNILGVLDVSGEQRSYHQHTMALVKMSARMIENHWLTDDYRHVMRLHFHHRADYIGTLMEGILAVAPDGKIVGANRGALDQLGLSGAALRMHSLASLFGIAVGALVDRFRSPLAVPMPVHLPNGRPFFVYARFNWPVWTSVAEAAGQALSSNTAPVEDARLRNPPADLGSPRDVGGLAALETGDSQLEAVIGKVRRVLDRDIPVLILGDTGTGKELLARAIHEASARRHQPFVAVNCAAIPENLIEAELFGHEEGAFTGARRKGAVGKILQANGGTLFLDEIGDMPLAFQARLLRVLQERQVTPLGSSKALAVDVALVCATHRNLREMMDAKQFRDDLYYRLNGLAVRMPSLCERSDLPVLVERILTQQQAGRRLSLSASVEAMFQAYHWPGNVRQLFNVLRTAAVMASDDAVITEAHLPDDFLDDVRRSIPVQRTVMAATPSVSSSPGTPGAVPAWPVGPTVGASNSAPEARSLQDMEIDAIRQAVEQAGGNISEAAKRLGVSRNTIYRKLRWREG